MCTLARKAPATAPALILLHTPYIYPMLSTPPRRSDSGGGGSPDRQPRRGRSRSRNNLRMEKGSLVDLLMWEERLLERCERHLSRRNLAMFTSKNVVITESYAGTCAGSFALGRAFDHAKKHCGHDGRRWRVHFACDSGTVQQGLLQSMSGPHKPRHVFSDILDRLEDDDRTYLDGIVKTTFAADAGLLSQWKKDEISYEVYKDASSSLCDDMYTAICNRLENATFRSSSLVSASARGPRRP